MNNIYEGTLGFSSIIKTITGSSIKHSNLKTMGEELRSRHLSHQSKGEFANNDRAWSIVKSLFSSKFDLEKSFK